MNPNRVWHRVLFLQNVTPNKAKKINKELHLKGVALCLQLSFLSENQPHQEARTSRASRDKGARAHALLCKALQAASAYLMLQGQLCEVDTVMQHLTRVTVKAIVQLIPCGEQLQWVHFKGCCKP